MKAKCLFAVICAVMVGSSISFNGKEEIKKVDADVVEKTLTVFENGNFVNGVSMA